MDGTGKVADDAQDGPDRTAAREAARPLDPRAAAARLLDVWDRNQAEIARDGPTTAP